MPLSSRKGITLYVHRKLLFRFRRLIITFIIITGFLVYEITRYYIAGYLASLGFIIGMVIGLFAGRFIHTLSWDAEAQKVVTHMDRLGLFILIAYLIFAICRRWIFSHWLHGFALSAFCLSIAAGGMLGRVWFTRQKIRSLLKKSGML